MTTNPIPREGRAGHARARAGGLRLPLVEATDDEKAVIRDALERAGVLAVAGVAKLRLRPRARYFRPESTCVVDHADPGPEPLGELERDGDVRAGRRAAEQPLLARGRRAIANASASGTATTSSKSSRVEERRPEADAAALDVVGARSALRDHRRLGRLDDHAVEVRDRPPERAVDAEEAAGRADVGAEGVEPAVELLGELARRARVAVDHVRVAELVGRRSRRRLRRSRRRAPSSAGSGRA